MDSSCFPCVGGFTGLLLLKERKIITEQRRARLVILMQSCSYVPLLPGAFVLTHGAVLPSQELETHTAMRYLGGVPSYSFLHGCMLHLHGQASRSKADKTGPSSSYHVTSLRLTAKARSWGYFLLLSSRLLELWAQQAQRHNNTITSLVLTAMMVVLRAGRMCDSMICIYRCLLHTTTTNPHAPQS